MFEKEIKEYENIRKKYQQEVANRMEKKQWMEYNEILFSAQSCAIEGNSFTVDDTRILREQGMAMVPVGRSLLECTEMADHFRVFDYMTTHLDAPFDETLLKRINFLVTEHTLSYRAPGALPGEYTTEDMAAGDTIFGNHETLIARVPSLMESTERALRPAVCGKQPMEAPVFLVLVADLSRYPEDLAGKKEAVMGLANMDAGYVSQNICLYCAAAKLATVPRATMDKEALGKALNLKNTQIPVLNNPVGYKRP